MRNGLVVVLGAGPDTLFAVPAHPVPPAPGPKLHPHQLLTPLNIAALLNTALPVVPVFDTIRARVTVTVLVPAGIDSAPPRALPPDTVLPMIAPPNIAAVEALPVTVMPPPSPEVAAFPVIVAFVVASVHSTQTMPPPIEPVLPDTVVLFKLRLASEEIPVVGLNDPTTAIPPPPSRSPDSRRVLLAVTILLFSTTEAPRILMPPPSDRNPCATPFLIVRLLTVTVNAP